MFGVSLFLVLSIGAIAFALVATVAAAGAGWHTYNRCEKWEASLTAAQQATLKLERTAEIANTFIAALGVVGCVAAVIFGEEVLLMIPHLVLSGVLLLAGLWLAAAGGIGWHLYSKCATFDDKDSTPEVARDISIVCTFLPILVVGGAVVHAIVSLTKHHNGVAAHRGGMPLL